MPPEFEDDQTPGTIGRLARSWRLALDAEGRSARTLGGYMETARLFERHQIAVGGSTQVGGIDADAIRGYLVACRDGGNSPSTVRTRYKGLRVFFTWLYEEDEIDANPIDRIKPPALDEKPVPVLTPEHIDALLKTCNGTEFEDRRDTALFRVLLDTGLRRAELANLRLADVDLDAYRLTVHAGKGNKTRYVPIGKKAAKAVDKYIRTRDQHDHADEPWLWLGTRGHLTDQGIRMVMRRRGAQAGLPDLHAHQWRHTFAHQYLALGGSENNLMQIMGWSSRQMLNRYGSSAASERALAAHEHMAPGDRL